jgi:hypothetical protein
LNSLPSFHLGRVLEFFFLGYWLEVPYAGTRRRSFIPRVQGDRELKTLLNAENKVYKVHVIPLLYNTARILVVFQSHFL